MKIAFFAQINSANDLLSVIRNSDFDDKFIYYSYSQYEEINEIYEKNKDILDGILFSGSVGYNYFLKQSYIIKIPIMFIENYFENYYLSIINHLINYSEIPLNEIYIDTLGDRRFIRALNKVIPDKLMPKLPAMDLDYFSPRLYDNLYNYIIKLWNDGEIKMAYIGFHNLYNRLKNTDLPCHKIVLNKENMLKATNNIIKQVELNNYSNNNTVVVLVDYMYKDRNELSINDIEFRQATLHKILVDYKKNYSNNQDISIIQNLTNFEISFKREYLENNKRTSISLIKYIDERFELDFIIGIGIGNNISECRNRGLKAINFAKSFGDRCGFIIENGHVRGPMNSDISLEFSLSIYNNNIKTAKSFDILNSNYTRIICLFDKYKENVTSDMVAKYLNITKRSANRIIGKLLDNNIIKVQDTKNKTIGKGRPTKYYSQK